MEFRILGPLEVWDGGGEVSLGGPKPRALLAVLLLHANEVVPTGRLVDADTLGPMNWRCAHQLAAELLDLLQPRYERDGDLARALKVARLRCTLPFEDMAEAERRLRRVTARLN